MQKASVDKEVETFKKDDIYVMSLEKNLYSFFKRVIDIVCSLMGIIILSPLVVILGICVKRDSKGPIFFSHSRLGKNGRTIKIFKFRTMVQNAEEVLRNLPEDKKREFEVNFKFDNDPRITRIGKFLRETSLDELPQLANILKGELSIVGPRPIVKKELEKYDKYAGKLLSVKPGLTGYWQVSGRNDTTYDERVQLDMYYIDNRSLWMDFKIMIGTFKAVLNKSGAR